MISAVENDTTYTTYSDVITMLQSLSDSIKTGSIKNIWSNIIDVILIAQKINNTNNTTNNTNTKTNFVSQLESLIIQITQKDIMSIIWLDIFNDNSDINMKKTVQQLLNGHKLLINYIGKSIDNFANGILCSDNWITIIINSMLNIINIDTNENRIISFCKIIAYDVLPRHAELEILRYLVINDNEVTDFVISIVSDDWAFQSIELILRDTNTNTDSHIRQRIDTSSLNFDNLMKRLVIKALEGYEPKVLIDTIFLRKPYNTVVLKSIVSIFPDQYIPLTIHSIASLWGNKYFLSKGNHKMIDFLTQSLLLSLDRIDKAMLEGDPGATVISMSSSIFNGVSSYFDCNDKNIRLKGMMVATKYSALMGNPIIFEELQTTKDSDTQSDIPKTEEINTNDENSTDSSTDNDEDEFSDIEAYDLEEELDDPDFVVKSSYLRSCLEMLQLSTEAHDKHKSALISIPTIIQNNPVDLHDISGPLVSELLRLNNAFNMDNFDDLRNNAILSLLVKSPVITIPVVTRTFTDGNHSIGDQLLATSLLIQSAYSIAEISSSSSSSSSTTSSEQISLSSLSLEGIKNDKAESVTSSLSSKTKIKRAAKLAQSKKQIIYFQNKFLSVSHLYYEPLFQLLSKFDSKTRETEINKSSIFEDTNIDKRLPSSSLLSISSTFVKDMIIDTNTNKVDDNTLHYLIPSKALSALGQLVKCLYNTTIQRTYSLKIIHISLLFASSSSIDMRQSSLYALYEAIKLLSSESTSPSSIQSISMTPLGVLQNLSRYDNTADRNDNDILSNPLIVNVINWCVKTANTDPDTLCRTLKYEIVKIAINDK